MGSDRKKPSCNETWGADDDYLLESSKSRDGNDSDDEESSDLLESSKSRDGNDSDDESSEWAGSSIEDEKECELHEADLPAPKDDFCALNGHMRPQQNVHFSLKNNIFSSIVHAQYWFNSVWCLFSSTNSWGK
jgi:hypothetical protein